MCACRALARASLLAPSLPWWLQGTMELDLSDCGGPHELPGGGGAGGIALLAGGVDGDEQAAPSLHVDGGGAGSRQPAHHPPPAPGQHQHQHERPSGASSNDSVCGQQQQQQQRAPSGRARPSPVLAGRQTGGPFARVSL